MSKPCWQAMLSRTMNRAKAGAPLPRVAIVGMGHELRGDDAAGLAVARALQATLGGDERVLAIDAGPAPESQTGPLRRFRPDVVLFVDAAQMDESPGVIRWLPVHETSGLSASTHTYPLDVLATFLTGELACEVALIGIQPAEDNISAPLTPQVAEAVSAIVSVLAEECVARSHLHGHAKRIGT
jgi:hydrogenase 3 maturation protease